MTMLLHHIDAFLERPLWAIFLCLIAGALAAFSMAPYLLWPLLLIGLSLFYILLSKAQKPLQGFWRGWVFGFGYFVFSLYWIGNALLVENNPYGWVYPLAVCGLPALLAFFFATAGYISARLFDLSRWHGYLGFVCVVSLFEWLRGHVFTGFPWNLFGYTWEGVLEIAQIAALESVYALSTLTVFWLTVVGFWIVSEKRRDAVIILGVVVVSMSLSFGFGAWRMAQPLPVHDNIIVKIVQPNTPQHEKWERGKMFRHFETALELSQTQPSDSIEQQTLIVWPETALSPRFLATPYVIEQISDVLNGYAGDTHLMTGALRHEAEPDRYYNSLITIDKTGKISNIYDKSHLVPFGEYIPFQDYIPLTPVTQFTGFQRGDGEQVYDGIGGLRYIAQICYETLFPHAFARKNLDADFVVNVTNDAWYGYSPGPYQHFAKARFRAIETGIPVIRSANTGISGVIDPLGRSVQESSALFHSEVIVSSLPQKFASPTQKPYFIHIIYVVLIVCGALSAIYLEKRTKR